MEITDKELLEIRQSLIDYYATYGRDELIKFVGKLGHGNPVGFVDELFGESEDESLHGMETFIQSNENTEIIDLRTGIKE